MKCHYSNDFPNQLAKPDSLHGHELISSKNSNKYYN